jgi:pseudouridine kinase
MTDKETEMYEIIRENPRISQNELAVRLGISRSAVSVHISHLMKKGAIAGREYILGKQQYVVVIGAANIDIIGRSDAPLLYEDSNPGGMELCPGGVGRNIAENLARLNTSVKLITAVGDDTFGRTILQGSESAGIDMSHCYIKSGEVSSTYIAVLDNDGVMKVALSDMRVLDGMPVEHLAKKRQLIKNADIIVTDAGLPEATLEYILMNFKDKRIFIDPVSVGKAQHAKRFIGSFDTIKANRQEAEYLSDVKIMNDAALSTAGRALLEKGLKRVFISLGRRGVYYRTAEGEEGICLSLPIQPVNSTGGGDAFMAGIVYCTMQGRDANYTAHFSNAMSRIALMSKSTVSPFMSLESVCKEMKKEEDGGGAT